MIICVLKKILEICAENHINIPADEKQFWCGIHKTRLFFIKNVSKQLKDESRKYLAENDRKIQIQNNAI